MERKTKSPDASDHAVVTAPQDICVCGNPEGENDDCERCQLIRQLRCLPPMLDQEHSAKLVEATKVLLTATNPLIVYEDERKLHRMRKQAQEIISVFDAASKERSENAERERNRLAS